MVSAFRALNEVIPIRQGTGMAIDWRQAAGTLLVGGDSRVIKVWDAQTETQGLVRCTFSTTIFPANQLFSRIWIPIQTALSLRSARTTTPTRLSSQPLLMVLSRFLIVD